MSKAAACENRTATYSAAEKLIVKLRAFYHPPQKRTRLRHDETKPRLPPPRSQPEEKKMFDFRRKTIRLGVAHLTWINIPMSTRPIVPLSGQLVAIRNLVSWKERPTQSSSTRSRATLTGRRSETHQERKCIQHAIR